jgi:ketosteroid isomerase-like protein
MLKERMREYYKANRVKRLEQMKQYNEANKLEILEQKKQYYENNKYKILEKMKVKVTCDCGLVVNKCHLARHRSSKKHQYYILLTLALTDLANQTE